MMHLEFPVRPARMHWQRSILIALVLTILGSVDAQDRAVCRTAASPHVRLWGIDVDACRWTEGFWAQTYRRCEQTMVPYMGDLLEGDVGHALNNFKIAAGLQTGQAQGMWWHDGDFYKWIEAATYLYAQNRDTKLLDHLDAVIDVIGRAQADDGYLSTPVQIRGVPRWSKVTHHELYNAGHLLTAASIHHRITGRDNFLKIAVKNADYLVRVFQPRPPELVHFGFNPSQIMGLTELYRETGDRRYLDLAGTFIDMRGATPEKPWQAMEVPPTVPYFFIGDQCQMRTPLREETRAVGHAVLGMYLWSGAADVYAETGEQALLDALLRIWTDVTEHKMYLTGAVGQTHHGASGRYDMVHEAFLDPYVMPNTHAYNETCANVANAMFNWRLLGITGRAVHADIMERVLYNSALSGISLDGRRYFYTNPLRMIHGAREYTAADTETPTREPYLPCFCCPPNLVRTVAKSPAWAYALSEEGVAVVLYGGNVLDTRLRDGSRLRLRQETRYPWDGEVRLTVEACKAEPFDLRLRIPGWVRGARLHVNGRAAEAAVQPGTFARLRRVWKAGDVVTLTLPMPVRLVEGHPRIEEVRNQAAVMRGPVVYCLESPDLPPDTSILDVYLPSDSELRAEYDATLLGGVTAVRGDVVLRRDRGVGMYRTLETPPSWRRVRTQFVPYYAWCNRGRSEMTVFVPLIWK